MPGPIARIVNRRELATLLDVSLPTIDNWIRLGCPYVQAPSRETWASKQRREWRFDLAAVVRWRAQLAAQRAR
jgi:phage terminase Nu1 subunit (DNA packaging protein)